ncbi:MAG: MBL fold metallo-hydrolase [Myxococcales bacterium]|nr:MBL fold metallo-hydrolase [Myxococcales bacterium]
MHQVLFRPLFDPESSTYTYLLADPVTRAAVLIDPVIEQVDRDVALLRELDLKLEWALDTHVHADHVTAMGALRERTGCKTALSERAGTAWPDALLRHGQRVEFGERWLEVRETPGHTNGCISFVLDDQSKVFTGDALLIRGCGRTDFQQGNAAVLYQSIHEQIFSLPDACEVYPGHDYKGRLLSSVGEEKRLNPRLGGGKSREQFVEIMKGLQLAHPKKIAVAVPANLHGGATGGHADPERPTTDAWAPIEVNPAGIPEVAPEWVLAAPKGVKIVDVREPNEFDGPLGHIAKSTLVPLATVAAEARGWDREAPIVLVCRSGGRSGKAAIELLRMGFRRVASMRGGMTLVQELASKRTSADALATS